MATYPATNSKEASTLLVDASNQMHQIVNEDALTEVTVDTGTVPSVRKALADTFLFQEPIDWNQGSDETAFNQLRTFDGSIYWAPTATLSNPIPMGVTPIGDSNWKLAPVDVSREWTLDEITTAQNDIIGGSIFKGSNGEYVQNGDTVPAGTTHVRILVGGNPTIVAMSPVASGVVSLLTEVGATVGGRLVNFGSPFNYVTTFKNDSFGSAVDNMIAGRVNGIVGAVVHRVGNIYSTGGTTWKCLVDGASEIGDFNPLTPMLIDDFGCTPDGRVTSVNGDGTMAVTGTPNDVSFRLAVEASLKNGGELRASHGQYNFHSSGVLSHTTESVNTSGYTLTGAGGINNRTVFMLVSDGSKTYFYEDPATHSAFSVLNLKGIAFQGNDYNKCNFKKLYSTGQQQAHQHTDCRISWFFDVLETTGNVTASEVRWNTCKITHIRGSLLRLNNPQSVNHEYYNVDAENIIGDVIYIGEDGGGSVKWFGGSLILSDYGPDVTDSSIVKVSENVNSSKLGTANQDFSFYNIKTELKDSQNKRLVENLATSEVVLNVKFDRCNLSTVSPTSIRDAVSIKQNNSVEFESCVIPDYFSYSISGGSASNDNNGVVRFNKCKASKELSTKCLAVNSYGTFIARGCLMSGGDAQLSIASDFDINYVGAGSGVNSTKSKTASLYKSRLGWPYNGGGEQAIELPFDATIISINVFKPRQGGSTSQYTLHVGNDDKSVIYGSSATDDQRLDHSFSVSNINAPVSNDANSRVVRLWADGGDEFQPGNGFVVVEYY